MKDRMVQSMVAMAKAYEMSMIKKGIDIGKKESAQNMLHKGYDFETVADVLNVPIEKLHERSPK